MTKEMKNRYVFEIKFLPHPKTGKFYELKHIKVKTKEVTNRRVKEMVAEEIAKTWPHVEVTIEKL